MTQIFVGDMFGIDDPRMCLIIRRLEPILASLMLTQKDKKLSREEIENLMIDDRTAHRTAEEAAKTLLFGQKKPHPLKREIRVTKKDCIVHVSKT